MNLKMIFSQTLYVLRNKIQWLNQKLYPNFNKSEIEFNSNTIWIAIQTKLFLLTKVLIKWNANVI